MYLARVPLQYAALSPHLCVSRLLVQRPTGEQSDSRGQVPRRLPGRARPWTSGATGACASWAPCTLGTDARTWHHLPAQR